MLALEGEDKPDELQQTISRVSGIEMLYLSIFICRDIDHITCVYCYCRTFFYLTVCHQSDQ